MIYFFAPGGDNVLANPKLRVGILDPAQRQVYETVLDMTTGTSTSDQLLIPRLALPEFVVEKTIELTTADTDITGVYVSEITGENSSRFGNRTPVLAFEQNGKNIIATNCASHEKIHATRDGDTITFLWANREGIYPEVTGEWKVNADGSLLEGTWDAGNYVGKWDSRGKWKLTRLDQAKGTEDVATIVTGNAGASTINITDQSTPASWRNLLSGNTATGKTKKGNTYNVYYAPNGKMFGRTVNRTNTEFNDTGIWEVTDEGQVCETWKAWRNNNRICFLTSVEDGQVVMTALGKPYKDFLYVREGDPEGLDKSSETMVKLSGAYLSENTGTNKRNLLSSYTGGKVILIQKGNDISGTYGTTGKIAGRIEGNTINFEWWGISGGSSGVGEWKVFSDSTELKGTWTNDGRHYGGTWNLIRTE